MSMTSSIIMSGPSNGGDPTIRIKQEPIIKPEAQPAEKAIEKKKERKVEETIIDGFAISAFESWEDLQDEINEVIASNLIKKRAAEQEAASNRRVGELVKKKKSKSSSSSKKSQPNTDDNSNSLLQPKPKADKVKHETKNDSSQSSIESSTGQSSKTTSTPSKSSNKRPKPENPTRENSNEGTSHHQSDHRENLERSSPHGQHKRLKDESQKASNDTTKHDVPTRPVDNKSHSPHLNKLYNITSNIQHIHSMQTSPIKQQTTHHPPTPPHPNRMNPQPTPPQSSPYYHYARPPPQPQPQPHAQPHFNPSPQTAPHDHYAQPPSAPPNHHQYSSYMAPPMAPSPYGFYSHHRPQFSSTMSTSSLSQPADLYTGGGGIITEQTISRQISMIPPPSPHPFGPPPGFGQYRMSYPPISAPYNHSIPAIQSHGQPSHPFPTYPETSPQATQRLLDLGAAYSAFMTSGRAPPGSFGGYPPSQLSLMAPPQASTANIYPPEMPDSKAFEYQRAISRYSSFNPHAATYPPRPQAFPSAWWPPSY